jgi:hypothetical protein
MGFLVVANGAAVCAWHRPETQAKKFLGKGAKL